MRITLIIIIVIIIYTLITEYVIQRKNIRK